MLPLGYNDLTRYHMNGPRGPSLSGSRGRSGKGAAISIRGEPPKKCRTIVFTTHTPVAPRMTASQCSIYACFPDQNGFFDLKDASADGPYEARPARNAISPKLQEPRAPERH